MTKDLMVNNNLENLKTDDRPRENHRVFYALFGLFCALLFIRNVFDIQFPIVIMLAMGSIICLFASQNEMLALALSCIPFYAGFQYKYLLIVIMAVWLVRFPCKLKNLSIVIPVGAMMIWELFHGALDFPFSYTEYLRGFAEIIFCAFIVIFSNNKVDFRFISRVLAFSTIFAATIVLLNYLVETNFDFEAVFGTGNYRFGVGDAEIENYGMNYNSNDLGFIMNLAISAELISYRVKKSKFDIFMISFLTFFGLLTLSRAFIICWIFLVFLFVLSEGAHKKRVISRLLTFVIIIISVFIALIIAAPYLIENFAVRFDDSDISNGRNELIVYYIDHILLSFQNCFFGTGLQEVIDKVNYYNPVSAPHVPHNGIIEILVCWGVPGLLIFVYYIFLIFKCSKKQSAITLIKCLPILLIILHVQSGQFLRSGVAMLAIAFAYLVMSCDIGVRKDGDSKKNLESN